MYACISEAENESKLPQVEEELVEWTNELNNFV